MVPAQPPTPRMLRRVITITAEIRQIDAADKRDLVVDHHELLLVTVHRTLIRVQRRLDTRPAHQLIARLAHRRSARREHRRRSPRPNSTRTSTASAASRNNSRSSTGGSWRTTANPGVMHQPAIRTLHRAARIACSSTGTRPRRRSARRPRCPGAAADPPRPQAPVLRRRALRRAPQVAQPASMMSARQTLDHGSRNTARHPNDIHRHHAQTIRRRVAARSGATVRTAVGSDRSCP
jgi:hypothetical protein